MMTNDTISKVISLLSRSNLEKMRACYSAYSIDWDGQMECRDYENKLRNMKEKPQDVAWAKQVLALNSTVISDAARKHFSQKDLLDALVKQANDVIAADLAACKAKAKELDDTLGSFAGDLSDERIAEAREFIKRYKSAPEAVVTHCSRATRAEIEKFDARLTKNQLENNQKAQAAKLDQQFLSLSPLKRDEAYLNAVITTVQSLRSAPDDVRRFFKVATEAAMQKLLRAVESEKQYLACEARIDDLEKCKQRTMQWCHKARSEFKELSPNMNQYRNAQKLKDLNDLAIKIHAELICEPYVNALRDPLNPRTVTELDAALAGFDQKEILINGIPSFEEKWKQRVKQANDAIAAELAACKAKAKELDDLFESFAGNLDDERIMQAREFIWRYQSTPESILCHCCRATNAEIEKLEDRLTQNQIENDQKSLAANLDHQFLMLSPLKRDATYLDAVISTVNSIRNAPDEVKRFYKAATESAMRELLLAVEAEKQYLACEARIDNLQISKKRTLQWCRQAWSEYKNLSPDIDKYRNGETLKNLNREATIIYTELLCEPFVKAMQDPLDFKAVLELDNKLAGHDQQDVLRKGIPSFDSLWANRVQQARAASLQAAGVYYEQGVALDKKGAYVEALRLFSDAETYGNANASYMLGRYYYYGYGVTKNMSTAVDHFKIAANHGMVEAMSAIGHILANQPSSYQEAFYWKKRAVEAGATAPRMSLALMYFKGEGTTQDYSRAMAIFEELAKENVSEANAYLGHMYQNGLGVIKNETTALSYYQKAPDITWAQKAYKAITDKLEGEQLDREIEDNLILAKAGSAAAQFYIGECYYYGRRTKKSYQMAMLWYERAADQKHSGALTKLGDMYMNGDGVTADPKKALSYYKKAKKAVRRESK